MGAGYGTGFTAVTNAAAGGADDERVAEALDVLREAGDVREVPCEQPGDLDAAIDSLDSRTLVVVGGDGSIHTAVQRLQSRGELRADRPLGLLPLGTGNDLARTLGIPLDPVSAARALLAGGTRPLDLVVDDEGGVVVNAVHLGVGAEAAARASGLKDRLGAAAYAVGSVLAGTGDVGWQLRVEVDGRAVETEDEVLMVGVANGRTIGGGAQLAPDAAPDDGLVDVVVATSTGPLARLGFATGLRQGSHVERDDVLTMRGRTVRVQGESFPVNADGELSGPHTERTWTVRSHAWSLLLATSSAGSD